MPADTVPQDPNLHLAAFRHSDATSASPLVGNDGVLLLATPTNWTSVHAPVAATQATTTRAAAAAGIRHVCNSITASIASGATAQTPINVYLRDGASGTGTIIWAASISAPANQSQIIMLSDLYIPGSTATAMTLEFSAAGVAASLEAVTLTGYDGVP